MDSVIYVSENRLSEDEVALFVQENGGQWHSEPPSPKGVVRDGDDVIFIYPPTLPSTEYAAEELEEIAHNHGIPQVLIVIDIGRSDGSPALAERFGNFLVQRFGGWLDGNGVLG